MASTLRALSDNGGPFTRAVEAAYGPICDMDDPLLEVADLSTAIILTVEEGMTQEGVRAIITCGRLIKERVTRLEEAREAALNALHPILFPKREDAR